MAKLKRKKKPNRKLRVNECYHIGSGKKLRMICRRKVKGGKIRNVYTRLNWTPRKSR